MVKTTIQIRYGAARDLFFNISLFLRAVHDVDFIRTNAHTDQLTHLGSLCRVNNPVVTSLADMHFKVYALSLIHI